MKTVHKILGVFCYVCAAGSGLLALLMLYGKEMGLFISFALFALFFVFLGKMMFKYAKNPPTTKKPAHAPAPVDPDPKPQPAPSAWDAYKFRVAGTYYREKDIYEIMEENDDYHLGKKAIIDADMVGDMIYKYEIADLDADLIAEPDNPHDPNAIKVVVNDIIVGYVPKEKTNEVKSLIESGTVMGVICNIYGGPYKVLEDANEAVERGETALKADVEIRIKK